MIRSSSLTAIFCSLPMELPNRLVPRWPSHLTHHPIILLLFTLSSLPSRASPTSSASDRLALLSFKSLISDPYNSLSSWDNATLHFCQWRGVTCGGRHPERVTVLKLDSLDLAGHLPPHIANLTFLRTLRLVNNNFRGSIPPELGRLSRLTNLNLSMNYLDGQIPESLTQCSNLRVISLRNNELTGEIPRNLGSLTQLLLLNLGENSLTGAIPPSIGNISSLLAVLLHKNGLTGSIPSTMGRLSSLQILQVTNNKLSGNIPSSLYNLTSMTILALGNNSLTGGLASNMFNTLPNLDRVILHGNQLEGFIPISLSNASNLSELDIEDNNFSGTIPSNLLNLQYLYWVVLSENQLEAKEARDWDFLTSLTNCSFLTTLVIESNRFGGILPTSVADLSSNLRMLLMGWNQISGVIPEGIGNLGNLTIFSLNDNLLTGSIPPTIGKLQQLHVLSLSGNRFTGQIPYSIGNLTQLNRLQLQQNKLNGSIPASFGNLQRLEELYLSQNKLTGSIPKELFSLSSLSIQLDLSHNFLTGSLPLEVGKLTNLNGLNISENKLFGKIPSSLAGCQSLEYLYMQGNSFNGSIPESLSKLKGLRELDLSRNNLSGNIPEYLERLGGLLYLNLSYNDLEGEVPNEGVFKNKTAVSVVGNKNLCGGSQELNLSTCNSQSPKKSHGSFVLKVILPVLGAAASLITFLIILVTVYQNRMKNLRKKPSFTSPTEGQFMQVSYAELLKATDGFSQSNLIGVGSVGSVYRGFLDVYNTTLAVKVLNLQQRGASKSFMAECEVLRNIRHRNLVKILTSCSSVDFKGNDFKALVLEFMPNGSLEKWLHPVATEHESTTLTLVQRLNIACDVASALEYLHHHCDTPIVHCDLKPSNVLLDADMGAHVGDFGLAMFLQEKVTETEEHETKSVGIKGTIGYVAPEYGMGSQVSTHGDVYSCGILLLELFTGKRPTDNMFGDGLSLHNYVEMAFPERAMDIVDPHLRLFEGDQDLRSNNQNRNDARAEEYGCLVSVLGIGLSCLKQDPRERKVMEVINKELCDVRDALLRFNMQQER